MFWCVGTNKSKRRKRHVGNESESDSEEDVPNKRPKPTSCQKKVEEIRGQLIEKHGNEYSPLQYRLWSEMVAVGTHTSIDLPPRVPMFTGINKTTKTSQSNVLLVAFTSMADAVAGAFKPKDPEKPATSSHPSSPRKLADLRSKYIDQLKELYSLLEVGALTNEEFAEQKQTILAQMRELSP